MTTDRRGGGALRRRVLPALALAAGLSLLVPSGTALAERGGRDRGPREPYTFAVIGDIPYGPEQVVQFPGVVDRINAEPDVAMVSHLGDIKSGSTECTDAYFGLVRSQFDRFADPLVYTPGDNEWTDCHRPNNGGYDPLERLDAIRGTFFDEPGRTLGQRQVRLASQARSGYPENVRYTRSRVSFGVVHVVGSNNGLAPWTGNTTATPEQTAEVLGRTAAAVETIRDTFATARKDRHRAVVIMTQADMFDPTVEAPTYADYYAFTPIVRALVEESRDFGRPVYLFNGDSHVYNADQPLAAGSPWLKLYRLTEGAPNLQRVTVDGSTNNTNFLKVTVNPRGGQVVSWRQVPYAS